MKFLVSYAKSRVLQCFVSKHDDIGFGEDEASESPAEIGLNRCDDLCAIIKNSTTKDVWHTVSASKSDW